MAIGFEPEEPVYFYMIIFAARPGRL